MRNLVASNEEERGKICTLGKVTLVKSVGFKICHFKAHFGDMLHCAAEVSIVVCKRG